MRTGRSPVALLLLLLVGLVLYGLMLANAVHQVTGGGEARMADAFEALFATTGLWLVLAIMLVVGALTGAIPAWSAVVAVVLIPASAVATFVAIDMCSRNMRWPILYAVVLPALIAFYAFWLAMPRWHNILSLRSASLAVWSLASALCAAAFIQAA
jgi:hypothetical protein